MAIATLFKVALPANEVKFQDDKIIFDIQSTDYMYVMAGSSKK